MNVEIQHIHLELGIPSTYESATGLPLQTTPSDLESIGVDVYGRPQKLRAQAASAWFAMQQDAIRDGVNIQLVSAYRSLEYQVEVIQRHLDQGDSIENILTRVAAPGYSEHQSGCAIDLTTEETEDLEEEFEGTAAFDWLSTHANKHSYFMSYPRDNPYGVIYEPWHWCYRHPK